MCPWDDEFEAGSFGDDSTRTEDDHEHGICLQMLADRDDCFPASTSLRKAQR
jgi:hypothetical protein